LKTLTFPSLSFLIITCGLATKSVMDRANPKEEKKIFVYKDTKAIELQLLGHRVSFTVVSYPELREVTQVFITPHENRRLKRNLPADLRD
jgi:hypothetical protein